MTFYYHIIKPDEMYLRMERDTAEEIEHFLKKNFEDFEWKCIDESEVPQGVEFSQRWPGMDLGFLPERRKKPRN